MTYLHPGQQNLINMVHENIKNTNTFSVKHNKIITRSLKYIYPEKSKEQYASSLNLSITPVLTILFN